MFNIAQRKVFFSSCPVFLLVGGGGGEKYILIYSHFLIVQKRFIRMNKYGRLKAGLIVSLFRIIITKLTPIWYEKQYTFPDLKQTHF